jgi:signal-transduction protein with cAMP-binding, CBS, and nucleotidyltransferase domain
MELRSILKSTKVGELTVGEHPTLRPGDSVSAAAEKMRNASHGSALICDADGRLVGIFTERDLLRLIDRGGSLETPLSDAMTSNPKTVRMDDTLFDATQQMDEGGYRRLPVVDANGAPVGIVDVKMVTHLLVEHFPQAVYNQAAHSDTIARDREGA